VVLFGPGDAGEPTAQEWADALGTLSYDIVTRFGGRVPRSYSEVAKAANAAAALSTAADAAAAAGSMGRES
jgi:Alanine racemase, C-terminal domain